MREDTELHQEGNKTGPGDIRPIKDKIDCLNIINKNYPAEEATRKGINTASLNITDKSAYKQAFLAEKEKEASIRSEQQTGRPDLSDFLEY